MRMTVIGDGMTTTGYDDGAMMGWVSGLMMTG